MVPTFSLICNSIYYDITVHNILFGKIQENTNIFLNNFKFYVYFKNFRSFLVMIQSTEDNDLQKCYLHLVEILNSKDVEKFNLEHFEVSL